MALVLAFHIKGIRLFSYGEFKVTSHPLIPRVWTEDTLESVSCVSVFLDSRSESDGAGANSTGQAPHIADALQGI